MEEKIKSLRRYRAAKKGGITKLTSNLSDFIEHAATLHDVKGVKVTVEKALADIESYSVELYSLYSDEQLEEEMVKDMQYVNQVNSQLAELDSALQPTTTGGSHDSAAGRKQKGIKLPSLKLPVFDGDPTEWVGFWELFDCSVHSQTDLTDIQKFTYLKGQLSGEALQIVGGFSLVAASYMPAVTVLKNTYGQKDRIKSAHIAKLCNLPHPSQEVSALKHFSASFECALESLRSMDVTVSEICAVLLHNKLPSALSEVIKRELKDNWLDVDEYVRVFKTEVCNMESRQNPPEQFRATATAAYAVYQKPDTRQKFACKLCFKTGHFWAKCAKYKNSPAKANRARQLKLCVGCLSSEHGSQGCTNPKIRPCRFCQQKHFNYLCPTPRLEQPGQTVTPEPTVTMAVASGRNAVLLPTIRVPLTDKNGHTSRVKALLDQCSQRSFILRSALSQLEYIRVSKEQLRLQGFTGSLGSNEYEIVELTYHHRGKIRKLRAVVVEELPLYKPGRGLGVEVNTIKARGYKLADPDITDGDMIGLLIGADFYYHFVHSGYVREGSIVMLPTIYGYALSGTYQSEIEETHVELVTVLKLAVDPLVEITEDIGRKSPELKDLTALWDLDHIGISPNETGKGGEKVLNRFSETVQYSEEQGQYIVELPWRDNIDKLPDNFKLALGRMRGLQRKFAKDPNYCQQYTKVLDDQIARGFIERVEDRNQAGHPIHYLAHHGITKDSVTTPVRIVFDCSARMDERAFSLNDCLHTGPSLVADLTQVLLRFRCQQFAWVSDIEKAFLMVGLSEKDRDATRFLWPIDPLDVASPYQVYRFRAVLFGATCSQFLLNATIQKHLSLVQEKNNVVDKLKRGLYIDNLQGTGDEVCDLQQQCWDARRIFSSANLSLREWVTNNESLRELLHLKGIASANQDRVKVLGVEWLTDKDLLQVKCRGSSPALVTKREALSLTASVFDPLGVLLPVTIRARRFVQDLWRLECGWDVPIPDDMRANWQGIYDDMIGSTGIMFPRQVTTSKRVTLHLFSDASSAAYGVAAYAVGGEESRLVMAKAKVAPIKSLTIPKMELTAVLLAARLACYISEAYADEMIIENVYLWSDSQITLYWLSSKKILPNYVQNRIDEIKSLVPDAHFRYVSTQDNPSDLVTRGITYVSLVASTLWWGGPTWLPHQELWPEYGQIGGSIGRDTTVGCNMSQEETLSLPVPVAPTAILNWDRYGSYMKSWHVMAWVLRFIKTLKEKTQGNYKAKPAYLTVPELRAAESAMIKIAQREAYSEEHHYLSTRQGTPNNIVKQLGLYMEGGMIRCRGRLHLSSLPDSAKYPILIPNKHRLATLLSNYCHIVCNHSGVSYVVNYMRQRWWIPKIRQVVKKALRGCVICKRLQGTSYRAVQAPPLPEFRVQEVNPFQVTGVDYTGALPVKVKGGTVSKLYVVLFTCAVTRAVHIETVSNLSCESFIHAFRRFSSRRGYPEIMLSDNATTFVSGANTLRELIDDVRLKGTLAAVTCEWRFIPARAPWFGAIWERVIGILKAGLKKVLGRAMVSSEELITILLELEATVNDRPLGYTYSDIEDPLPITPSQLVHGRRIRSFPRQEVTDEDLKDTSWRNNESINQRLKYVTKLSNDLWKRWSTDYLISLREQHHHLMKKRGIATPQVGDVVLVHDEGPRLLWRIGRIIKLLRGPDHECRVVQVKTGAGLTTRPVVKLYPLEIDLEVVDGDSNPNFNILPATGADRGDTPQRPSRRAALGSSQLWRSMIGTGQL